MKKRFFIVAVMCAAIAGWWSPGAGRAFADVPGKMNYQGKLTNAAGGLVADGSYGMTFGLFDALTGGAELWSEAHGSVQVTNGLFNVILGSASDLTSTFQGNDSLYIEVAVGGETLSPRQEMVSVGYALEVSETAKLPSGVIVMWSGTLATIPGG